MSCLVKWLISGSRCSFPFTYKGKVYNECTSDKSPGGLEKPWCATLVKKPGEDPASWGYCHDNCFKWYGKLIEKLLSNVDFTICSLLSFKLTKITIHFIDV